MKQITIAAMVAIAALGIARAADPEPIRLGAFLAATGPGSFLGDPEAKTLKLEVDRINREGGLLGRPIKLVLYDSGSD
ncbi:MAG TPA: ABC transporter substrate-binding protein, partial [Stellaceae bacterium]|nr:ABC transporter substrate-binding protein [Stellaceae bacterium]